MKEGTLRKKSHCVALITSRIASEVGATGGCEGLNTTNSMPVLTWQSAVSYYRAQADDIQPTAQDRAMWAMASIEDNKRESID